MSNIARALKKLMLSDHPPMDVSHTEWHRLQVMSRKTSTNYRALLRKMTYEYKASHDSTPLSMTDNVSHTEWRRIIGCLVFIGHFPQKLPSNSGSLREMTCSLRHPMSLRHPVSHVLLRDL